MVGFSTTRADVGVCRTLASARTAGFATIRADASLGESRKT
ncbi:hypothetical protein JNB_19723 [Janibacter sp. HTCC2649]|nr:hypothetical protein JNB_19723 [Janibacter sp. HTCC2649]